MVPSQFIMLTISNLNKKDREDGRKGESVGSSCSSVDNDRMSVQSYTSARTTASNRKIGDLGRSDSRVRFNFKQGAGKSLKRSMSFYFRQRYPSTLSNKPRQLENTYKMAPDSEIIFRPMLVHKEVKQTLESYLKYEEYSAEESGKLTAFLTDLIKDKVKEIGFKRHKFIVQVVLGSKSGQSLEMASRCLWDPETDNFVSVSYENGSIIVTANIYAVYFE